MKTLVDDIVALEHEAEERVSQARTRAHEIDREADAKTAAYRQQQAEELARRVAAFREDAEARVQTALADAQASAKARTEAVAHLSVEQLDRQAIRVVERLKNG